MSSKTFAHQPFDSLQTGLLQLLQEKAYGKDTINNYRRKLNHLGQYMSANEISDYTLSVGQGFINDYLATHMLNKDHQRFIHTIIRRLDDYCMGNYLLQSKTKYVPLSQIHTALLDAYLQKSRDDGNRKSTISKKRSFLHAFFSHLESCGCHDLRIADIAVIGRACLMQTNKDGWAVIRMFLQYLNHAGLMDCDFSAIVPHFKRAFRLPSIYTEEEVRRFEDAINVTTKIGKRDYAMLLLATRLGMRSGDIANLTFSDLDFQNNTIRILQEKTCEFLILPILPVVKNALLDYLKSGRPESALPYVFLRVNAPFEKMSTSAIRYGTSRYFGGANIDTTGKKHGPHVFRSSLASSMINQATSYDIVRKILGHTDPNAVKHYAKVDIGRLREYAIEPPAPSGNFKAFLEGWV